MNRREFVWSTSLLSAMSALGLPSTAFAANLPREDIRTFSKDPTKVARLREAVKVLDGRPFTDHSSWYNFAAIHDIPSADSDIAKVPAAIQALWSQCHKDESIFFLWHRAYVWSIEKMMRAAIGKDEFRLPYWDWYSDPSLPEIFRAESITTATGSEKNFLYRRDRNPSVNDGAPIWFPELVTDFNSSHFEKFQGQLNSNEHGNIHMAIGTPTNMGNTKTAARDPIFWLHHANIDRLLPVWLRMGTDRKVSTQWPTWVSSTYRFPSQNGAVETPSLAQLDLNGVTGPDYAYESVAPPTVPKATVPQRPATIPTLAGRPRALGKHVQALSTRRAVQIGAGATVSLPINQGQFRLLDSLGSDVPPNPDDFTNLTVIFDGISAGDIPAGVLGYRVFLNLPEHEGGTSNFVDHFLGGISLFGLGHGHGDHAKAQLRFSATEAFIKLMKQSAVAPSSLYVSIVPVLAPEAAMPKTAVFTVEELRIEASTAPVK